MKNIILLAGVFFSVWMISCHEITVGYLTTENAGYDPDSLIVKHVLNIDSTENVEFGDRLLTVKLTGLWQILGYVSPEQCVEELYGLTRWDYTEDYERLKLDIPWLSTKIQGVKGTQQIYMQIKDVKSDTGNPEAMKKLLSVRGDGMFKLPLDVSSIPVGRYVISLNIYNEGYSHDVDDCFTIIVVEK